MYPRETEGNAGVPSFAAIQLLYDPQQLAEKLLSRLLGCNERFEVRGVIATVTLTISLMVFLVETK
jgi:hypothetical protein